MEEFLKQLMGKKIDIPAAQLHRARRCDGCQRRHPLYAR
jgi:hypothetical protein